MGEFRVREGLQIDFLAVGDEPSATDVLAAAFRDNPMNRAVIGAFESKRLKVNTYGLSTSLIASRRFSWRRVIRLDDRVAAALIAFDPGGYPAAPPPLAAQLRCLWGQGFRVMKRWGELYRTLLDVHPKEPHCYLALIGVRPELQGRGLGRALLYNWLAEVDSRGAKGYLETDREELIGYYGAAGFEVERSVSAFGTTVWCMARAAGEHELRPPPVTS
jgi:ribosomal protein S18 acetylase RimI-like enzyme